MAAWFSAFGLSSWAALGDISDEDWKVVYRSIPSMRPDHHDQDRDDHSRLGPGHWNSLDELRKEAREAKKLRLSWERRLRKEGRLRLRKMIRERRMAEEARSSVTEAGSSVIGTVGSEEPGWEIVGDVGSEEPEWEIVGDV